MAQMNAPLRGQTEAVRNLPDAISHHMPPSDPAAILIQPAKAGRISKKQLLLWIGGGVVAAQLLAPYQFKPFVLAGTAAAGFYEQIMHASAVNQVDIAHRTRLADRLGRAEADYADARARCMWGQILSPEAWQICTDLVDASFLPTIRQMRQQLGR